MRLLIEIEIMMLLASCAAMGCDGGSAPVPGLGVMTETQVGADGFAGMGTADTACAADSAGAADSVVEDAGLIEPDAGFAIDSSIIPTMDSGILGDGGGEPEQDSNVAQ